MTEEKLPFNCKLPKSLASKERKFETQNAWNINKRHKWNLTSHIHFVDWYSSVSRGFSLDETDVCVDVCFFLKDMDSERWSHVHDLRLSLAMSARQVRPTAPSQGRPSVLGCLVNPSDQETSVQPTWPPLYMHAEDGRTGTLQPKHRGLSGFTGVPRGDGHAQGVWGRRCAQAPGTRTAGSPRASALLDSGDSRLYLLPRRKLKCTKFWRCILSLQMTRSNFTENTWEALTENETQLLFPPVCFRV